ncbi:MAG: hypothetical protein V9E83_14185 [Baekduia sp.]
MLVNPAAVLLAMLVSLALFSNGVLLVAILFCLAVGLVAGSALLYMLCGSQTARAHRLGWMAAGMLASGLVWLVALITLWSTGDCLGENCG